MIFSVSRVCAALLLGCTITLPVHSAQAAPAENAEPAAQGVYEDLYASMLAAVDNEAMIENQIKTTLHTLVTQDANVATIEEMFPGFLTDIGDAMRPVITEHSSRAQKLFEPRFVALLAENFTVADARRLATFYRSPVGIKLAQGTTRNFTGAHALGDITSFEEDVSAETVQKDINFAAIRGANSLSAEDYASPDAALLTDPVLMGKMDLFSSQMFPLRAEMENHPMDADVDASLIAALDAVFAKYDLLFEQGPQASSW